MHNSSTASAVSSTLVPQRRPLLRLSKVTGQRRVATRVARWRSDASVLSATALLPSVGAASIVHAHPACTVLDAHASCHGVCGAAVVRARLRFHAAVLDAPATRPGVAFAVFKVALAVCPVFEAEAPCSSICGAPFNLARPVRAVLEETPTSCSICTTPLSTHHMILTEKLYD